jgi:hypothetical protein
MKKGRKVRCIFFSNFIFVINAKFDADFKNTCFVFKSRHLSGEKLKKWCGNCQKLNFYRNEILSNFFFLNCVKFDAECKKTGAESFCPYLFLKTQKM